MRLAIVVAMSLVVRFASAGEVDHSKLEGKACETCHGTTRQATSVPSKRGLKLNHKLHGDRGVACATCHEGKALPAMKACVDCHEGRTQPTTRAAAKCGTCHVTLMDGRLQTDFSKTGGGKLVPLASLRAIDTHGPGFVRGHAVAGRDDATCMTCHKRRECEDCHGRGTVKPFDFHLGDYIATHALDARRGAADCASCHRSQTFCVSCHQRSGVAADPEGGQRGKRPQNPFGTGSALKMFHPPGWAREANGTVIVGRASEHARQARLNIRTCASCHREESCLECHSNDPTGSLSVSPHGPKGTFAGTAKCRALSARNQRACLKCHRPGDDAPQCR